MEKLTRKYPLLGSSVDHDKLALTIKGVLITAAPAIVILAGWLKIDFGATDWQNLVELAWQVANQVILAVGMATTLLGAIRKIYWKIKDKQYGKRL